MLMRFHYGLGVGHIYSHRRVSLTGSQQTCNPGAGHILSDDGDEDDGDEEDEDDGSEDDQMVQHGDLEFGSSSESLGTDFDEMYCDDLELDYEN